MRTQTIDQLLPLLDLLDQPAFCLRDDGAVVRNQAACHLAPGDGQDFPLWLGLGALTYAEWDRKGSLELPVLAAGQEYYVTIHAARDGLLCLMKPRSDQAYTGSAMSVAAQVLRQPLTDLSVRLQHLSDQTDAPALLDHAAAMQRQLYRISRIAANLTDLDLLSQDRYPLQMRRLDTAGLLEDLLEEAAGLARECGRSLEWALPQQRVSFPGDADLLRRAVLNLISNALKYSPAGTPISVSVNLPADRLLIQVKNTCEDQAAAVLRGAFDRLEQRGVAPDPRWGVGLGLPLAQAIARLHGGAVALEVLDDTVNVILSISRRRSTEPIVLRAPVFAYDGGMRQSLLELSDALPIQVYHRDAL